MLPLLQENGARQPLPWRHSSVIFLALEEAELFLAEHLSIKDS